MSRLLTELGGQTANRIPDSTVAVKMSLPHWPQRPIISLHRTAVQDMWSCQRLCHLTCRVPLGLCGPRPSDDNVAPPPKSAGYSDCSERGQRSEVGIRFSTEAEEVWRVRLLPGISFTVVFSRYDVFKQLSTCHTDTHRHTTSGN